MDTNESRVPPSTGTLLPPSPRAARMRGQATVLLLVLSGVLCLGLLLLFDTGQAVNKKVQLTNTADAAAYSVAVQQARVMNYAAYMNRGRVANEVAIAQMVSMWSWMNMMHTHTVEGQNFFTWAAVALTWFPPAAAVAKAIAQVYKGAEKIMATTRQGFHLFIDGPSGGNGAIQFLDEFNGLYAGSANLMLGMGGTLDGIKIAKDVVKRNDSKAEIGALGLALLSGQLLDASSMGNGLLDEFKPNRRSKGMDRYRNVVMASRDYFSADRSSELGIPFIDLETKGGTDMVGYDRWAALDTLDLEFVSWDVPLGFGGAQAVNRGSPKFFPGIRSGGNSRRGPGWKSDYHPGGPTYKQYGQATHSTGRLAAQYPSVDAPFFVPYRPSGNLNKGKHAYLRGYEGLRTYHDVKKEFAQTPEGKNAGPVFTVYVQSDRKNVRTSEDIDGIGGPTGGQLDLKNDMSDGKMTAIASAEVYFNRPPNNDLFRRLMPKKWNGDPKEDDQLEMGSLFSPYWQARLTKTPSEAYVAVGLGSIVGI